MPLKKFISKIDLDHSLKNDHFVILEIHSDLRNKDQNMRAKKALLQDIQASGKEYAHIMVRTLRGYKPAFIVFNLDPHSAELLAKKYGQFAHIESSQGSHSHMSHKGPESEVSAQLLGHHVGGDYKGRHYIIRIGTESVPFKLGPHNESQPVDMPAPKAQRPETQLRSFLRRVAREAAQGTHETPQHSFGMLWQMFKGKIK